MSNIDDKNKHHDNSPQHTPDIQGTVTEDKKTPKKIKLFFSKKVWIAIFSFVALTMIGGIIEFTVQTPISRYIEKFTGPRTRTLRAQLKEGNYEFVFRNIKEKFYNEPAYKKYKELYQASAVGTLRDLIKEHEWEKSITFLKEAVEGMPVSTEFRTQLRRIYVAAQPERLRLFKKTEHGKDKGIKMDNIWHEVELIALKENNDALIQYEVGRTMAEIYWYNRRYNVNSLRYFERALKLDPMLKDKEIINSVLEIALLYALHTDIAQNTQSIIGTYYLDEYGSVLRDTFKPYPFEESQATEKEDEWNRRMNAYIILSRSNGLSEIDKLRFFIMSFAHLNRVNEQNTALLDEGKAFFEDLKKQNKFKETLKAAELPRIIPASVFSYSKDSAELKATWPVISTTLSSVFEGYSHERLFYKYDSDIAQNAYRLLKKTGKLTSHEKAKLQK